MVLSRLGAAVGDVAETLRRAFTDLPCHSLPVEAFHLQVREGEPPSAVVRAEEPMGLRPVVAAALGFPGRVAEGATRFEGRVAVEDSWARWAHGAQVAQVEPFQAERSRQVGVPALPRRLDTTRIPLELTKVRCWGRPPALEVPGVRRLDPQVDPPRVRQDLAGMRDRPLAVEGELPESMGAAWSMRQLLQLVRQTGENARNLELLGCFSVPERGVEGLVHDPRRGCLWVRLGAAASGAVRRRLILARRRDDRQMVSCFAEEG